MVRGKSGEWREYVGRVRPVRHVRRNIEYALQYTFSQTEIESPNDNSGSNGDV